MARRNTIALIGLALLCGATFRVLMTLLMGLPFDSHLVSINNVALLVGVVLLTGGVWQEAGRSKES